MIKQKEMPNLKRLKILVLELSSQQWRHKLVVLLPQVHVVVLTSNQQVRVEINSVSISTTKLIYYAQFRQNLFRFTICSNMLNVNGIN